MFQIFRVFLPANLKWNSSEQQTVAALLNLASLKKILATKGLHASLWHAAEWRCESSWKGAAPHVFFLLHPTHPPLAPSAAAFTNEVFHLHLIFSPPKHPEAEVYFTGSQITMFWFTKFSFKKKTGCRFVLKKQMQPPPPHPPTPQKRNKPKNIVKEISLWAENFATEDDKGSMRSDLTTADPHSQNTNGGKGQLLMERMAPAVPEVMLGDYTWLVWKGMEMTSRLGEVQLVTCYIEHILSMASIEPEKKKSLFSLIKNTYRNACFEENIIHFFLV